MAIPHKSTIMCPENERWDEFIAQLATEQGCNFKCNPDNLADPMDFSWDCDGSFDKVIKILTNIGKINIEATIKYFKNAGAFCDCEVFLTSDKEATICR